MVRLKKYTKKPNIAEKEKNSNVERPIDEATADINSKIFSYESFSPNIIGESPPEGDN